MKPTTYRDRSGHTHEAAISPQPFGAAYVGRLSLIVRDRIAKPYFETFADSVPVLRRRLAGAARRRGLVRA